MRTAPIFSLETARNVHETIRTPTACCIMLLYAVIPSMSRGKPILTPGYPISPL